MKPSKVPDIIPNDNELNYTSSVDSLWSFESLVVNNHK